MKRLCVSALVLLSLAVFAQNKITVEPLNGDFAAPLISALASSCSKGCEIHLADTSGRRLLNSVVPITVANVHLVCDGSAPIQTNLSHTPLGPNGYYYSPFDITGENFEMNGCHIDATSLGTTAVAIIHLWGAKNAKVHDNSIYSSEKAGFPAALGVRVEGNATHISTGAEVYANFFHVPSIGFSVGDYGQIVTFHDNTVQESYQCFDFNGSGSAVPDASQIITHNDTCISSIAASYVESATDVSIDSDHFQNEGATQPSLRIHSITPTSPLRVRVNNCDFTGNAITSTAIEIFQNAGDWQITNNRIRNMGTDGITIDSTSGTPMNGTIADNEIVNSGQRGANGGYCGIRLRQSKGNNVGFLTIMGNKTWDEQSTPTQLNGICSDGGQAPFNIQMSGNTWKGKGTRNAINFPEGCSVCERDKKE